MRSPQDELDDASRHDQDPEQLHSSSDAKNWPLGRAIGIYLIFLFVTWGCVAPMIARQMLLLPERLQSRGILSLLK